MLTPTRITIAAFFLLMIFLLKGQDQAPASAVTNRFQLVQGEYVAISGSTGIPEKGLFRVDTTNGRTWRFETGIGPDRKLYIGWRAVTE